MSILSSICSTSGIATAITCLYMLSASYSLYRVMNPLFLVDVENEYSKKDIISPYWSSIGNENEEYEIKVYLSTLKRFSLDFLASDDDVVEEGNENTVLLWDSFVASDAVNAEKEVILLFDKNPPIGTDQEESINKTLAMNWFDAKSSNSDDFMEIFQDSFIIKGLQMVFGNSLENKKELIKNQRFINLARSGSIFRKLIHNETIFIHALVLRHTQKQNQASSSSLAEKQRLLSSYGRSHSLQMGVVSMVKHDDAVPIKPPRILYYDLLYMYQRYITSEVAATSTPPWNLKLSQPKAFQSYQQKVEHKKSKTLYPYWKPEVSIRLVPDEISYPYPFIQQSYPIIKASSTKLHPSGYAYLPPLHVDEIGLTSEKYILLNDTITALPLRLFFDATSLTPQRWRLLSHFSHALDTQKEQSELFENEDIDEMRRLIADTNVTLLCVIILASVLHLLFEFLTFKNDVQFWNNTQDITGLSIRALFVDFICQFIICLYLIDKDSSLLVTIPAAIGVVIALWKCQRGAGLKFVKLRRYTTDKGWFAMLFGYEIIAEKLNLLAEKSSSHTKDFEQNIAQLSLDMDKLATSTLSKFLIPPLIYYSIHNLLYQPFTSWYSYLITTLSSFVYGIGFIFMTPQLFLNYKLKSVAHLPWKVLVYKFLNTFIDDLFALVIRMPTMARIGVFRDDIVFFIYLGQRWCYEVDTRRPAEGGAAQNEDDKKKKD